MKKLTCATAILILLFNLTLAQSAKQTGTREDHNPTSSNIQAAAATTVTGSGTSGHIPKWVGASGSSVIGDSNIFEDKFGKVGIGTISATSTLTVQGMIETTLGGYKFPDGTLQTTAAVSGLQSVFHNATLTGNGTIGSPLSVAVPLELAGAPPNSAAVITAKNTGGDGSGVAASGGNGTNDGNGVDGFGGGNDNTQNGGAGVNAGGGLGSNFGGPGLNTRGGSGGGHGGDAVQAIGGNYFNNNGQPGRGVSGFGGVNGEGVNPNGTGGDGVFARGGASTGTGVSGHGVTAEGGDSFGNSGGTGGTGVHATGGKGSGAGNAGGDGLFATAGLGANGATNGRAGAFLGDVRIVGNLDVTGTKNFKIDHPLDPENKYLIHAAIESSEVLNVYSGNVTTTANGEAIVTLPDWFEALNKDFRYQLTVVGTFAQAIVAQKIKHNRFTIKTNAPSIEVSWQVTGVRSDEVMRQHPFKAEQDKPDRERGSYLTPERSTNLKRGASNGPEIQR